MEITAQDIARALLNAGAVALRPEQPFRFASGILSPVYCDNRLLLGRVEQRRLVARALASAVRQASQPVDLVAGTATAGIAWAAWIAEQLELPMAYVRSGAKAHGKGNQIEGGVKAGQRAALIEDTISTGGSSLEAAAALRNAGVYVASCWCIFSYQMAEALAGFEAAGIQLRPLTTLESLLGVAVDEGWLSHEGREIVEEWAVNPRGWRAGS